MRTPRRLLLLLLLGPGLGQAQLLDPHEPTPFRLEQLEGRPRAYNNGSFLQRLSFEPMPYLGSRQPLPANQFRGTAGSTNSDRLYVRMEARAVAPLESGWQGEYRFRRHEDFDGTFSRNLIGLGWGLDGWRLTLFGEVAAEKEDADVELELRREWGEDNWLKVSMILPDAWYNTKSQEGHYDSVPYTYFAAGRMALRPGLRVGGFVQADPWTRHRELGSGLFSAQTALSGGGGVAWTFQPTWTAEVWAESLAAERSRASPLPTDIRVGTLDRAWDAVHAELRHETGSRHAEWLGYSGFAFQETDARPNDPLRDAEFDRKEHYLTAGIRRPLSERHALTPYVMLGHLRTEERFPHLPEEDYAKSGFQGKTGAMLDWILNRDTGARITLHLGLKLHEVAFAGGNVQLVLPF